MPARGPASTNLPARNPALRTSSLVVLLYEHPRLESCSTDLLAHSPTHVIHQLHTSLHASSLKCEHGTYEPTCSYPHTRVTRDEPPRSYHHMFTPSMNLPIHGTTSLD
ncbi:hypothetical protein DEO72_LG10g1663 [Vigna unguiculata]|uniref:Uncharacterized protein n=1 Tax=Vigna unguiculata TaxID=3917 RepID=A0A4D6N9C3_VIGUN|nr:hypothetical protein DEO72_LG10g1663 [Vigna unguiculata]